MLLSAGLVSARAHAQAVPKQFVDLTYRVDPALQGCPSADEFRSMVAQRLGYDPYRAGATLGVQVRVRSAETGIEGAIDWSTTTDQRVGERHFASRSGDCHQMMATMGFVLAVQIQLMATEPAAEDSAHSAETEPTVQNRAAPRNAPARRDRRVGAKPTRTSGLRRRSAPSSPPWSATAGAGPSVGFGLGPDPIVQGRLLLTLGLGQAALELGVEASLPSTTELAQGGGFRHELMLGTLGACGCYGSISACGLAKLGRIQVHGTGVDRPASPAGFFAQAGPGLAYSLALGDRLGLLGHLDALYLLTPWTVDLNHVAVWTMPRLSAVAGIDLTLRFR
ncbi:MAG: hypothetical protein JW940_34940 [Polyangiaceae bacterium]|nr:hypothetical protein [Polyangiaceae bacterium]